MIARTRLFLSLRPASAWSCRKSGIVAMYCTGFEANCHYFFRIDPSTRKPCMAPITASSTQKVSKTIHENILSVICNIFYFSEPRHADMRSMQARRVHIIFQQRVVNFTNSNCFITRRQRMMHIYLLFQFWILDLNVKINKFKQYY